MGTVKLLVSLVIVLMMNSGCVILKPIPTSYVAEDKQKHFVAGFGISTVFGKERGVLMGCGAGVAKEAYDSQGHGTVEFADFVHTCVGASLANWLIYGENK